MLELLQSNNMSALVNTFCQRNGNQVTDPFEATTVVVQSFGIGQWLKHQLAERTGIAANINCLLPADLIWQLYQMFLPQPQLPRESPFSRHLLTWRLMQLLPNCQTTEFEPVQHYLNGTGDSQLRLYQLSEAIAGLYDQYLIYRPDWINQWQSATPEKASGKVPEEESRAEWQWSLWRQILELPGMDKQQHRASLHNTFINRIQRLTNEVPIRLPTDLPNTISVFGLSSLPVMHMQTLQAIAQLTNVDIYFLNPCEHYWGDIVSEKDVAKRSIRQIINASGPLSEDDYLEVGNPLLASFGKQGREFLELLLETPGMAVQERFEPATSLNVLSDIKNDILNLEFGGAPYNVASDETSSPGQRARPGDDSSVQLHCCHSRMREIEVLYDQILGMIDNNNATNKNAIRPVDIIVMAPDIARYAPFIQAVFQGKLYFSITDRPVNQESAVLVAFEKMLNLPDSRLSSTEVMDLLEVPAIRQRFNLDEADLATLIYWVRETGIRWEADGQSKHDKWNVPASDHNTWQFGLKRLLMGFAMQPDKSGLFYQSISPFDVNPGDSQLIGTFCHFVDQLTSYRQRLSQAQTARSWYATLNDMIDDFFVAKDDDEFALNSVRDALTNLTDQTDSCHFDDEVSHPLLRHWLTEQLSNQRHARGFISGGVTFATLVPMRSIPFQVVCLIGMNDREFPREDRPPGFDLMASDYRKGDRSKRNDDRYLFLEALLSAGEHFYISYEGRSLKDNKIKPPSVLVSEFNDYLLRVYGETFVVEHPLQPFNEKYFDNNYPKLKSYSNAWYQALTTRPRDVHFQNTELGGDGGDFELTNLRQLTQFFRNPAEYYFRCLGVYFGQVDFELADTESFQLDSLERYNLAESALEAMVNQQPLDAWEAQVLAGGHVMEGVVGQQHLQKEMTKAASVYEKLTEGLIVTPESVSGTLVTDGLNLEGEVRCFSGQQINYRTGTLRKRQLLHVWLQHLFLNATGYEGESYLISTKKDKAIRSYLKPINQNEAIQMITSLVDLYQQGIKTPLPFLPETSFSFLTALDKNNQDLPSAREKALQDYTSEQPGMEGQNYNYNRLFSFPADFSEQFATVAHTIYDPLLNHWEEDK
ncbi:MAG: exodeoxyribonuclease V subunit gamma [bacterium]|nr:exodeoxyribonuclease V subunit gamma [Gammaproteobacteria bacterium]